MDTIQDAFTRKFSSANKYLGGKSLQNIVSLKYRDNANDSTYVELVDRILNSGTNLRTEEITGEFQGKALLVTDKKRNKVILVEHEWGLEILYVAGSIASLGSLIPIIISAWHTIQTGLITRPYEPDIGRLEIRMLDSHGHVVEDDIRSFESYLLQENSRALVVLEGRVKQLERQLAKFKKGK